jgi:predicted dehydrogenase
MNHLKPIKVAFIGAGAMAQEHARAFGDISGVTLAGIHSRTRARAQSLADALKIRRVSDSVTGLYEETRADLVVIAVKELALWEVCQTAFALPWTVFMEKPPGYNLAGTDQLLKLAESCRQNPLVGLNRRHLSSTLAVTNGLTGVPDARFIQVFDQEDLAGARAAGHPEEVVRHWMFANAIHMVDYLRFFGRGTITGVQQILRWNPLHPGMVVARVDFDGGDIGLYQAVWHAPGPWAVVVTTPAMRYELRPVESAAFQRPNERTLIPMEKHPWDTQFKPGFRRQAGEIIHHLRGQPASLVSLSQARETMELIHRIYLA